jgi:hypothetical protein
MEKKAAHLPVAHNHDLNHRHHCRKNSDYHQCDQCDCNKRQHHSCHCNDQHNDHPRHKENDFKKKYYEKRDDRKRDHFKKKDEILHNKHSSSSSMDTLPKKGVTPCQGFLLSHTPVLTLAQAVAKRVTQIIMSPMMTASKAAPSKYSYSDDEDNG